MHIILVANTKGGVGKTTFAQHFVLPALKKAVFVDTDTFNSSINNIKNSKYLVDAVKLRAVKVDNEREVADIPKLAEEFFTVIEKYSTDYIIVDTGGGTTASSVLKTLLVAFPELIKMVFIPTLEVNINIKKTVDFVSSLTDRCMIVNVVNQSYDDGIYIPEISSTFFEFAKEFQITLPEISDIDGQLNIRERGIKYMYEKLISNKVNQAIESVRRALT
ncbi:MAG: hypothetical protein QXD60_01060 [Nanopusillaceae archaeon]